MPLRCLLVDDNDAFLETARALLERQGVQVAGVASNIAGYRDVIANRREGLLVPVKNEEAIAESLVELLSNPVRRHELEINARQTALGYAWQAIGEMQNVLYDRLYEPPGA